MPELPEVETIRRGLVKKIKDKKIVDIWIEPSFRKKISPSARKFLAVLKNNKFSDVKRRAKLIILLITDNLFVLVHLKMTGQLIYRTTAGTSAGGGHPINNQLLPSKFTRVILSFDDQTNLYFNDIRKFGYLKLVDRNELDQELKKYGREPLEINFTFDYFKKILVVGRKRKMKTFLLDQSLIAGLGNIYSDEICFEAGVRPTRRVESLSLEQRKNIYWQIKMVLKKALKYKGTSIDTYVISDGQQGRFQNYLKVYGRTGEKCFRCRQGVIIRIKFNGRSSCYCPDCQK
jgi:formamidopyrimidine-DNA glycosylase